MRPPRPTSGITLKQLLLLVFVLSVLGSLIVASQASGRRRAAEARAVAALRQIVSAEHVWRSTDSDRNGAQDYWALDVAGFCCLMDANNTPLRYIPPELAAADTAPATRYPGLPSADPRLGFRVQAMITDENGAPYVDPSSYPVYASPVSGMVAMNCSKYGFCAWLDTTWGRAGTRFIVNEEDVVYRAEMDGPAPVTNCPDEFSWTTNTPMPPPWKPAD